MSIMFIPKFYTRLIDLSAKECLRLAFFVNLYVLKLSFVNSGFLVPDSEPEKFWGSESRHWRSPGANLPQKGGEAPTASSFLLEMPRGLFKKSL